MNLNCFLVVCTLFLFGYTGYTQSWHQVGNTMEGKNPLDLFGSPVSISGDGFTVAITAQYNDDGGSNCGQVRVYSWDGTSWVQKGPDLNGEASEDAFGFSIFLSSDGNTLAVGSVTNDGGGTDAGSVRVFTWTGSVWQQRGNDINGEEAYEKSGTCVAMDTAGTILAIGAPNSVNGGSNKGKVRIYKWNGTTWQRLGSDLNGLGDEDLAGSGLSMNANGEIVAIGAFLNDAGGNDAGQVRVYSWNQTDWVSMGTPINGEGSGDFFGTSVSLNATGHIMAVGAPINTNANGASGHVRVFKWNGNDWVQQGSDIDGSNDGDFTGISVSLSGNGHRLAIGSPLNDNGDLWVGKVNIYQWSGSDWVQIGQGISGDKANDQFGRSVELCDNGNVWISGARGSDVAGLDAGQARVYSHYPIGIPPISSNYLFSISPNPTQGNLLIDLNHLYTEISIVVTNITGQLISAGSYQNTNKLSIDINGPPGVYLVTITTCEGQSNSIKVIKE